MSVVQGLVAAVQQPPPSAKPSRLLPQREVSVENDTVHTVILTFKKIGVLIAKSVAHGWRIIRQHLVIQLPLQGPLFLSEVSEKAKIKGLPPVGKPVGFPQVRRQSRVEPNPAVVTQTLKP